MINNMRRLYPRDVANRGICVDGEGAMLGPNCVLVSRSATGYRELEREEAAALQRAVLDDGLAPDWLFDQSRRIAQALNSGQIALAQIHGLYIPIDRLDNRQLRRLAGITLAKAGFNPDEPRVPKGDPHGGEWTTGGDDGAEPANPLAADTATGADGGGDDAGNGGDDGTSSASVSSPTTPGDAVSTGDTAGADIRHEGPDGPPIAWEIKPQDTGASDHSLPVNNQDFTQPGQGSEPIPMAVGLVGSETEWLATLTPTMAGALRQMLLEVNGAGVFLGFLFVPTNRNPIVEGPISTSPGVSYRFDSDMGILQLRQDIGSLGPVVVSEGHIGVDGLFRDAQGRVIGRYLSGSGVIIDAGALPGYRMLPDSATAPDAGARNADQPKLCPDPSAESIAGRSDRSLAYQEQITGLPRGLEVKLNDVRFDGCVEADGTILEAKGPGFADKMDGPIDWQKWFTGVEQLEAQMRSQARVAAAAGRTVEWHFAERPVADFFRKFAEANGLTNIIVIFTPPRLP